MTTKDPSAEDPSAEDPYTVLGLDDGADDDAIKRRYLALVRAYPPERAPERFQEIRAAYEAVRDAERRLRLALLKPGRTGLGALLREMAGRRAAGGERVSRATVTALLNEGLVRAAARIIAEPGAPP